jgi:hypothetical protein
MKVVLALANSHKIFLESFLEACADLGLAVVYFLVDDEQAYEPQRQKLVQLLKQERPDKLLLLNDLNNGRDFFLDAAVLRQVPCYLWFLDTMANMRRPDPNFAYYKDVFSFEPNDLDLCAATYNRTMQYVPFTAGRGLFCSQPDAVPAKKYDVSFVGLVAGLPKRLAVLEAVAKYCHAHQKKLQVYGHFWHNAHALQAGVGALKFKVQHPELATYVKNVFLTPTQAAELYAQTRINLNIHNEHHTGPNCRTFEILGNDNFELCDQVNFQGTALRAGTHLAVYADLPQLLAQLDYYLQHDAEREQIARQGGAMVRSKYKLADMLRLILQV